MIPEVHIYMTSLILLLCVLMIAVENYKGQLWNTAAKVYLIVLICLQIQEKMLERADFQKFKQKLKSFEIKIFFVI
jgi:hypothetical protein